jgi:hypothetical protein
MDQNGQRVAHSGIDAVASSRQIASVPGSKMSLCLTRVIPSSPWTNQLTTIPRFPKYPFLSLPSGGPDRRRIFSSNIQIVDRYSRENIS